MEELLREMERYAFDNCVPIVDMRERKLLLDLLEENHGRRVLEIGTAIGYSALIMASALPAEGEIITIEINERRAELARKFIARSPCGAKIKLLQGDAGVILENLRGKFDFVFMDAAKGQYVKYFRQIAPLLSDNAIIAADNVFFHGLVTGRQEVPRRYRTMVKRLKAYTELVQNTPGFLSKLAQVGDGMMITWRKKEAQAV